MKRPTPSAAISVPVGAEDLRPKRFLALPRELVGNLTITQRTSLDRISLRRFDDGDGEFWRRVWVYLAADASRVANVLGIEPRTLEGAANAIDAQREKGGNP